MKFFFDFIFPLFNFFLCLQKISIVFYDKKSKKIKFSITDKRVSHTMNIMSKVREENDEGKIPCHTHEKKVRRINPTSLKRYERKWLNVRAWFIECGVILCTKGRTKNISNEKLLPQMLVYWISINFFISPCEHLIQIHSMLISIVIDSILKLMKLIWKFLVSILARTLLLLTVADNG